jgi:type VII secretion integral membrane protein EccD
LDIIGLARVTISAPQRRVDVALPEQLPLAELLPEVLRHAGEGLADDGERHGGWILRRTDGTALATGQPLIAQGVRDGEVLHLVPARAHWPELEYDDVVETIADGARRRGGAWSGRATRLATLAGAGMPLAVGLSALLTGRPTGAFGAAAATGVAVLLIVAATIASRAYGDGPAAGTLGGYALPYAFAGGALLVSSGDPVGPLAPLRWLGAAELLAGAVALLLAALLGLAGAATRARVFVAGVTGGLGGALAAPAAFLLGPAGAAAVLLCALVLAVGVLPLLAIRLGRVPLPPVTLPPGTAGSTDTGEETPAGVAAARDRPDRGRVDAAVTRTEEMLAGMLLGHAVLTVAASGILVLAGGVAGRLLTGVAGAVLLLRSRLFAARRHRVPLIVAGLANHALLGTALVAGAGPAGRLGLVAAGLGLALLTAAAGATYAQRPVSPYLGRAADLTDTLLVVSVVPVACAVLDLYARARALLG